ncbi:phage tail tip lysozyme [Staphylococcus succinus]|uniref:phage tail tip lysozyme n=1 Tax=Staphylococcus succinus TaxID=61015 RepID=UPI000E68A752|nr:phage tail tip lysozyme [Staphylococcus succinus]RIN27708.1 amidase [Staphylococcus succinus]
MKDEIRNTNKIKKTVIKLSVLSIFLLGISPELSTQNTVEAEAPTSVLDGQNGCPVDTDDFGDSESKKEKKDSKESSDDTSFNTKYITGIYNHLHDDYGFSGVFIAGILANWFIESNIDPKATQGDSGNFSKKNAENATSQETIGIGYGQWTNVRHTQLTDYAKKKNKKWYDSNLQLDFMVKQDSSKQTLKELALNSGKNPKDETVNFHDEWEVSASSRSQVLSERGEAADKIWKYMKKNGMNGSKDESKIKKINGNSGESSPKGASSATNKGVSTTDDPCADQKKNNSTSKADLGESTKKNGKKGKVIGSNYTYSDLPEKYKKYIKLPKFDDSYIDKPGNPYLGGNEGQCTELTWAYMWQLWGKRQAQGDVSPEEDGNGDVIYKSYKKHGAKLTEKPTVGYGFSSNPPYANAAVSPPGHTGVVVGVMPDGKFITASFNVNPHPAKSRIVLYSVIDGTDGNIHFFSGVKGSKSPTEKDSKDKK